MAVTPHDLGTERISKLLARYAVPAIIAMASMSLYNIIDSVFIGHAVGAMALSGLAIAMPLMNISAAFGAMVGIGSAALISINLGEGKRERTFQILGNLVLLNLIMGITLSVVSLVFLDDILRLFGASDTTLPFARDFMQIILLGCVITHLFWGLNEVMRASGYPQRAMAMMLTAIGLTAVFNAIFLFWFGWGIRGSAFATVLSQVVALGLQIAHFSSSRSFLHFRRGIFRLQRRIVGGILSIGIAPFLLNFCTSIVVVFVNDALIRHGGDLYAGAYGIMNRVVMLFIMICAGFNQGMQPIVGYNYGAQNYPRVVSALRLTIFCAVGVMSLACLLGEVFPEAIARMFVNPDDPHAPELISISAVAMRIVMALFPIAGFQIVTSNFFQYIGKAWKAILLSMTRQMLFLVPLLLILPRSMGALGVWVSFPIADAIASSLAAILLFFQLRRFKKPNDYANGSTKVAKLAVVLFAFLCVSGCHPGNKTPSGNYDYSRLWEQAGVVNISIARLRDFYMGSPMKMVGEYRLSGTVVSRDRDGNFHKTLALDDGTGGVEMKLDMEEIFKCFQLYTRVMVRCNGLWLSSFGGALQLSAEPYPDGGTRPVPAAEIAAHLQNDNTFYGEILPRELTFSALEARHISTYVAFDGVWFESVDSEHTWADTGDTAEYYSDRYLVDGSGARLAVRTSRYASFAYRDLPKERGRIEGVLGYSGGRYYLTVMSHTDFISEYGL